MKKVKKVLKGVFNFTIISMVLLVAIWFWKSPSYPMQVKISDNLAVDSDNDSLEFGSVLKGSTNTREFGIRNVTDHDIKIYFLPIGGIRKFVKIDPDNSITLRKGESEHIQTIVDIPPSSEIGKEYTGSLKILRFPLF